MQETDVAIVGAGIVGLANAWSAARRGLSVAVFERSPRAIGASIRNFGMVWPIGQPAGAHYQTAIRSRDYWREAAQSSGLWVNECGSLHLAHRADEWDVLQEFVGRANLAGVDCELITPNAAVKKSPAVRSENLLGAMWSPSELCVNPREALPLLSEWLSETHGVAFQFGTPIRHVERGRLENSAGKVFRANHIIVCSGDDFRTLFPRVFATIGLTRCKLQMLRTGSQPGGWNLRPHLAGGLTLRHYRSFEHCDSLAVLKSRIAAETPELDQYGIHVMAAQNNLGQIVLGDSHEYGDAIEPFHKSQIDELILRELRKIIDLPDWTIAERWSGTYAKHPDEVQFTAEPIPGVRIMTATGGAGMTMSFGLAEKLWDSL